jgi:hypothetical protein
LDQELRKVVAGGNAPVELRVFDCSLDEELCRNEKVVATPRINLYKVSLILFPLFFASGVDKGLG